MSDIGSTDNTALHCHTNYIFATNGGDWHGPDQTGMNGFTETRSSRVVRLKRVSDTQTEGIYHCSIRDAASITQTVFVGLYNSERGNASSGCHDC